MVTPDPDVIVVGGGAAGCVVAARLANADVNVLLVEAGPDPGPWNSGRWPADMLCADRVAVSHDWGYEVPANDGRPLGQSRARILGGCTAHNGCTQSVGLADDWDALGVPALAATQVSALLPDLLERLRVHVPEASSLSPFQRRVLEAAESEGHQRRDDLLDLYGGAGSSVSPVNVHAGTRWNAALAFLDDVRHRGRLTVLPDAMVDRVVIDRGRTRGIDVTCSGIRRRIESDAVVLCAGAFGTPEILLRSGIGPAEDLRRVGVVVNVDLPTVGEDLADQPVAVVRSAVDAATAELMNTSDRTADEGVVLTTASAYTDAAFDHHVFPWTEPDPDSPTGWSAVLAVGLLRPYSRGRLVLRSRDPGLRPAINPGYLTDVRDAAALLDATRRALPLWDRLGLLDRAEASVVRGNDPEGVSWLRRTHVHYWHPIGGAVAGADGARPVDGRFRVRGVEGLRVADASVFAAPPRATTALPTTVVGAAAAQTMLETSGSAG